MPKEELPVVLNLRISTDDERRLQALAEALPRSHVARTCLRLGLELVEKTPALLLGQRLAQEAPPAAAGDDPTTPARPKRRGK
ncbi:MAG: hypothetical protein M9894_17115 [Planctomycetes bacterium]|nr:hypothetical protein [Planctomycetota bacterium]